jgi:hypothetical protein
MRRALFLRTWKPLLVLAAVAALLPVSGQSRLPPETDGSTYTWAGAATLAVDVKPWGGGYVRSSPYLIDCPLACVRPLSQNREVTLTAYVTPGHTFSAWEGACAGQGNPCTLQVTGAIVDVTAVFTGQVVPPAPPAPHASSPPTPPAEVNPAWSVDVQDGECPACFTMDFSGTGFHANSPIDLTFSYASPASGGTGTDEDVVTSDAGGSWSAGYHETCEFDDGTYSGPVVIDVTATDAEGASASTQVNGTCPAT